MSTRARSSTPGRLNRAELHIYSRIIDGFWEVSLLKPLLDPLLPRIKGKPNFPDPLFDPFYRHF